ncbi:sperm-associated antigen 7 homolog [Patella vulgata]|uniref:sperm-associated antigen 7 homolog n=1 Tax=Patella vulgata TaxID=6465 RepID=UPI00217FF7CC|nr:sperm-associated antigen 7 homolog [Patella vulgata]
MDLLGSILGSMQKPPTVDEAEKKKAREQKKLIEKKQSEEKKHLDVFRMKTQKVIHEFIKDEKQEKYKFKPLDKVYRAIVHEVADVAGLTSFSFGQEEEDRYVMLWKKEFAPSDEEVLAYRRGEVWDPEKAKQLAKEKELQKLEDSQSSKTKVVPASNYRDKYKHLIGEEAAKDAAQDLTANKSYGFVSSQNKRDTRTIEQVLADTRAKKKQKTDHPGTSTEEGSSSQSEISNITGEDNSTTQSQNSTNSS